MNSNYRKILSISSGLMEVRNHFLVGLSNLAALCMLRPCGAFIILNKYRVPNIISGLTFGGTYILKDIWASLQGSISGSLYSGFYGIYDVIGY